MVVPKQRFFDVENSNFIFTTLITILVGSLLISKLDVKFSDMVKVFLLVLATQLIAGWYAKKQVIRAYANENKSGKK